MNVQNKKGVKGLAVLFFLFLAIQAHSQLFYPSRPLEVIKTEWFDIIYPEESAGSAERLAAAADGIYDEIANRLNVQARFRFPVVI
ncbi:MAG: hypothetical protein LBU99_03965, partial [Spirochaetaceae bacterium]|nr:hypothetical protein [Spirochaetaceae bacterium]